MPRPSIPPTEQIVESIVAFYDGATNVTTDGVRAWCLAEGYVFTTINARLKNYKSGRGRFDLSVAEAAQQLEETFQKDATGVNLIPTKDPTFVPFGNFTDIKTIIKSQMFYPCFITGLSGNGKTHGVEQACAQLGREVVRVNITIETDEDDLLGGFRLVDGNTAWHDGPVIEAMQRGAILLLDEIDLASNKIMCLQSILEGKGLFIKKTGVHITPKHGFNVIATANTKGRSDETGRFIGTNVLNEAFLERFAVTFEQKYPSVAVESKIITRVFASVGYHAEEKLIKNLVDWADIIRVTFYSGGVDDVISTRRLINIVKAISIWGDVDKAITLTTARFDQETAETFRELFQKISGDAPDSQQGDNESAPEADAPLHQV